MHSKTPPVVDREPDCTSRRRMVKTLASLPAVMTLASGSASAISSIQECALSNSQNPVSNYPRNLTDKLIQNGSDVADCLNFNQVSEVSETLLPGDFYDQGSTTPVREGILVFTDSGTTDNKACVVFVQDDGNGQLLKTFDGTLSDSTAVTASCLASIALAGGLSGEV